MRHVLAVCSWECDYTVERSTPLLMRIHWLWCTHRQVSRQVWYFSVTKNCLQDIYTRTRHLMIGERCSYKRLKNFWREYTESMKTLLVTRTKEALKYTHTKQNQNENQTHHPTPRLRERWIQLNPFLSGVWQPTEKDRAYK